MSGVTKSEGLIIGLFMVGACTLFFVDSIEDDRLKDRVRALEAAKQATSRKAENEAAELLDWVVTMQGDVSRLEATRGDCGALIDGIRSDLQRFEDRIWTLERASETRTAAEEVRRGG